MSKALSITELADLLGNHWETAEPEFRAIDSAATARPIDMAALAQTAVQLQAAAAMADTTYSVPAADRGAAGDDDAQNAEDPLRQAWEAGFESGVTMERRLSREASGQDRELLGQLRDEVKQVNADGVKMLESRLREAVLALCRQAIDDYSVSPERLTARIQAAVKMLTTAHNEKTIEVSPGDLDVLRAALPAEWKLVANAELVRGAIRVTTPEGGVEDGPDQWKLALEEAIRTC
jgi:flagellar assembly protein FliH